MVTKRPAVLWPPARGFSLVEMLVAGMVILVIAAIAIPSMLQARMRANEASAVASMSVIHTAEAMYQSAYPQVGYAASLADLGTHGSNCETPSKTNSCIIMDDGLTSGLKNGYTLELTGDANVPRASYTLTAMPASFVTSGRCIYRSDQSGRIQATAANAGKTTRFSLGGGNAVCRLS